LPVVRVLITGFDRFPRPTNHPSWHNYSGEHVPQINPSGWAVRNFDPLSIDPALRKRARIEVHRLNDVPVLYVEGARAIVNQIQALDADVAISFGVGADGGADADVESECSNIMHDGSGMSGEGPGPFHLPASWPPAGPESDWSDADRAWLWRYPDNGGVSYNSAKIDPALPDRLRSSLPVDKIVARAEREGLRAHSGMSGPGQYICNNVMFKVVDAQAKRGKLGGFIHMRGWSESGRESYLKVLRCAIEESVRDVLDRPTSN
jgi:pyrrolidone-carboxylate peptidase